MHRDTIKELKKRIEEQCKALGSLASSLEGENRLGDLVKRVDAVSSLKFF
ncbi:MAG: hypothetical protein ACP5IM_00355 [Candidatus Bathyarchaeia archaeon]